MAQKGHQVSLVVADAHGDASIDGVQILDVGRSDSRLGRIFHSARKVFDRAVAINADMYILHDPELIPYGIRLKHIGKAVVFDSHEDIPVQVLGKPYLGRTQALILSRSFHAYQQYACHKFDGIVAATPFIRDKLIKINSRTIDINNYPIMDEFDHTSSWDDKSFTVCYVGNITAIRGIRELIEACSLLRSPAMLTLAGTFETPALAADVAMQSGWSRVKAIGHLDRTAVCDVMAKSMAGLVTLHPQTNYIDALPVKMFEYMAAGIPVIASDFPRWREIIETNSCGICVDPLDPASISEAIDFLITHPAEAKKMGANGRQAVMEKYNWHSESKKMLDFYDEL